MNEIKIRAKSVIKFTDGVRGIDLEARAGVSLDRFLLSTPTVIEKDKQIEQLQRENDEKDARIVGLESFFNSLTDYLTERQVISIEEWMADWTVRKEIHDRPKQSLRQIEAKAIQKFINSVGTRTGDIIEIDVIDLPQGKYWLGNKVRSES